jgi:hypothetical protein
MGSDSLTQFITQALYMIPLLLVGIFSIVALYAMPVPARVRAFAAGGLALILVNTLGGTAFYAWYAHALSTGGGMQIASMMGVVRLLTSVLHAFGLALLVAAVFVGRGIKPPF